MRKEYLEALEIECGELVEMDLLFLDRNGENQEKWHNSEAFNKAVEFEKKYGKSHTYILKQALQRLESIDNANPSEAMKCLDTIKEENCCEDNSIGTIYYDECNTIKQALLKAQELKSENNALLEENKDLYFELELAEKKYKELIEYAKKQEKVLEIIKERQVNIALLVTVKDVEEYNFYIPYEEYEKYLTQEEFDLLKRWLG